MPLDLHRRSVLSGLASSAVLTSAAHAHTDQNNWRNAAFEAASSTAETLVDQGTVAGLAVGISTQGYRKSAYFGLADRAAERPVDERTQFRIASVTKPVVAAAALQMVELGVWTLDDSLAAYLPDFPLADDTTIYHLLTHTAGIENWWGRLPADTPQDFLNSGEAHLWLAQMDQVHAFAPGSMRAYSNSGFVLLGEAMEKATGMPLDQALKRLVLSRVGAGQTFLEQNDQPTEQWARGYASSDGTHTPAPFTPAPFAAGGLRATLHDVLAFGDAVFLGPLLEAQNKAAMVEHARVSDGRRVEDAMYLAPGQAPEVLPEEVTEMGYGLGINTWVQSGERFYSHAGLIDGFGAYFIHAPRTKTTAVMLSNSFQGTAPLHEPMRQAMIAAPDA